LLRSVRIGNGEETIKGCADTLLQRETRGFLNQGGEYFAGAQLNSIETKKGGGEQRRAVGFEGNKGPLDAIPRKNPNEYNLEKEALGPLKTKAINRERWSWQRRGIGRPRPNIGPSESHA